VGKRIAVPQVALFKEEFQAIRTLRAGAPAERTFLGAIEDHIRRALDDIPFFISGEIPGHFVMITMAGNFMPLGRDRRYGFGIAFGDAACDARIRKIRQIPVLGPYSAWVYSS